MATDSLFFFIVNSCPDNKDLGRCKYYTYKWNALIKMSTFDIKCVFHILSQRISFLVRLNKFQEALELALSFYTGTAKAVVGQYKYTKYT